ncbi:MAG TPA: hypothetical protein VFU93_05710 [Acidimicrobiales bacterium]|nr:hypothetical protein [Acidimicrobiales bacterium]
MTADVPPEPDFVFSDETADANRYATLVDGRRLTVSIQRFDGDVDRGTATWTAYWEDEHRAGVERTLTGTVDFKHHVTAYDAERVVREAARRAPGALPGDQRPAS